MGAPLVSIHIVTYNQVDFIHDTLSSALGQEYENVEVVVSDDGSTDGTVDIIMEFAKKHPDKLVPIINGSNSGITKNCNRALRACKGKYIAFLGGDDLFFPGKIKKQVAWMEADEDRVISGHDVEVFDSRTKTILGIKKQIMPNRAGVGARNIIIYGVASFYSGTSIMVRRDSIPEYGFDERLPIVSDWKFVVDCLSSGGKYGCVEGTLAGYRKHGKSVTDLQPEAIFKECIITIGLMESQYPNYLKECKIIRAKVFYKIANYYLRKGDRVASRKYIMASVNHSSIINSIWRFPLFFILTRLPMDTISKILNLYRAIKYKLGMQMKYY